MGGTHVGKQISFRADVQNFGGSYVSAKMFHKDKEFCLTGKAFTPVAAIVE